MEVEDSLAGWMLDSAVMWFGLTIENALEERVKVGYGKNETWKPKYTLTRLLNQNFKMPKPPPSPEDNPSPWSGFLAWLGKPRSGVKKWKYVGPLKPS